MRFNISEIFPIASGEDAPQENPSKKPSLFQTTFHDYDILKEAYDPDELDDADCTMPLSFDLSGRTYTTSSALYYVNERILEAHNLILDDCVSPYEAWARAMNTPVERLAGIMGLADDSLKRLLDKPSTSPPKENVRRFCDHFGVHPAYLQPGTRHDGHSYHPSVLAAMSDLMDDAATPQKDRTLCEQAFATETKRFEQFKAKEPVRAAYLADSMSKFRSLSRAVFSKNGLPTQFSAAASVEADDIDAALDNFERYLTAEESNLAIRKRDAAFIASNRLITLIEYGDMLYGCENSEKHVLAAVKEIEKAYHQDMRLADNAQLAVPGSYFDYCRENILDASNMEENEMGFLDLPPVQANFELQARKAGCNPQAVKEEFLDELRAYMTDKPRAMKTSDAHAAIELGLQRFTRWRNSADSERDIALFRNAKLAETYLPQPEKKPLLSLPAAEKPVKLLTYRRD